MPTVFTHPAVALAVNPWFRDFARRPAILVTGVILTILPDLDVISFYYGIPYGHMRGHRGLSHSLPFAFVVSAVVAAVAARLAQLRLGPLWLYFGTCLASHGLLDACTNGGSGVAFFAPFSHERYFFPVRPIDVSPIGLVRSCLRAARGCSKANWHGSGRRRRQCWPSRFGSASAAGRIETYNATICSMGLSL